MPTTPNEFIWFSLYSIVIAIAGSLLYAGINKAYRSYLASMTPKRARRMLAELDNELQRTSALSSDPAALNSYILSSILRIIFYFLLASAIGSLSGAVNIVFAVAGLNFFMSELYGIVLAVPGIISVATALLYLQGVRLGSEALQTMRRVQNFDAYRIRLEKEIAALEKSASASSES
jgi:hypothetical protein